VYKRQVLDISPATIERVATAAAWQRTVTLTLMNSLGDVHTWANLTIDAVLEATTDSAAGAVTIEDTAAVFENGVCTVVVSGDESAWLADETNTLTVSDLTILGYTVSGGTSVETIIADPEA
jgi:hypothetical protein